MSIAAEIRTKRNNFLNIVYPFGLLAAGPATVVRTFRQSTYELIPKPPFHRAASRASFSVTRQSAGYTDQTIEEYLKCRDTFLEMKFLFSRRIRQTTDDRRQS
ncbi:hypothetical protein V9T40_010507 [Parthenolecanium corni]|uniref:Uncharacterized protein n=1 Tax=Parthenolecanium corni TaxID=536013 RepID=A0AAN9TI44_9HEMI